MRQLKIKSFDSPETVAAFINENNIKSEDIQSLCYVTYNCTLYYWEEEKEDDRYKLETKQNTIL